MDTSIHEARLFLAIERRKETWSSNRELAAEADIALRTARSHTAKLVENGVLDVTPLFPGHRYRLAKQPNAVIISRLKHAISVFGLSGDQP